MTRQFSFRNELVNGIHARPAAELENRTKHFQCQITLLNTTKGTLANAKSVLALVGADVTLGDECQLQFEGSDQDLAYDRLHAYISNDFAHCDTPLETIETDQGGALPISLAMANPDFVRGQIVCQGIGKGIPVIINQIDLHKLASNSPIQSTNEIQTALTTGISSLIEKLTQAVAASGKNEQEILRAHLQIAADSQFAETLEKHINQKNSLKAIAAAADELKAPMLKSSSTYLKERALDIEDICTQLAETVVGKPLRSPVVINQESVVIADNLAPSELLALDKSQLNGLVLSHAGQTSHTVILARSFGIPVLTGIQHPERFVSHTEQVIIDAIHGVLIKQPSSPVLDFYQMEQDKAEQKQQLLKPFINSKGIAKDGTPLAIYANIAIAEEASPAFASGAEGIGLFRTEMLFMEQDQAPSEQEQFMAYAEVIKSAQGKQTIIRTLDIGGDKPLPYLGLPEEENPFLGYRAVRMYPEYRSIFETQLRAILRASEFGAVDIMIPMVSCVDEVKWVHQVCQQCADALSHDGAILGQWRLGIMLEVPSTLYLLEKVSPWIDFVSVGSNDLTQYFMACDRGNHQVRGLYNSMNPSFIGLLNDIATRAKKVGVQLGLCGEMASDINALPLLLAMGFDEISLPAPKIPAMRAQLSQLDNQSCLALLHQTLAAESPVQVVSLVEDFYNQLSKPEILDHKLVIHNSKAIDKASVIKALTDTLELHGRASKGHYVEQAIWDREEIFATSLGFGIAVPHCKSEHVLHNSISVAHLAQPILWSEKDNERVSTVIMLSIASHDTDGTHMNIFSRLARKLMHKDFRDSLTDSSNAEQTVSQLKACLFEQAS
ncbi:phosphoenolpyruvate--protein phosphotransferase [Photobacterium sp. SDRW27]|uniref:phosphoenolpyruvate--protein phosphotransferase n=1 Tax=Photobacterium obscurum TaxID=2829490 RepID=UPI002244493A|nr:phosphoenolpyruvate--protein phosphotransferase [Photobacterium obscurum]MCW8331032.1 phosphoenolpyruvate--protein phosphotransferase [Photobacterium obscurum]